MSNIPDIRFKGFNEPWEQHKLGDVTQRVQGNDGRMDLPTLTISAGNGWLDQRDRFSSNIAGKEQKNYTLLHKGELSYNHGNSKLAKYGTVFSLRTYEEALVPRVYHSFKVTDEADADFIEYVFATKLPDKELGKLISSGARMDGLLNINYDEFMSINILMPSIEEQQCLSDNFRKLDTLITLHQRKCDEISELKKYMLQKMFPKNGEQFPEIRFSGFTEPWEQGKLIDICDYVDYRGKTPTKTEIGIFLVTAKNVKDGYIDYESSKEYISEEDYEEVMHRGKPLIGDVLITTEAPCGNVAQINRENVALAQRIIKYRGHDNVVDNTYLKYYLLSPEFQDVLNAKSSGGTVRGIKGSILHQQVIQYPLYEEQLIIGQYLDKLDTLITLHQRKCDALKEFKKFMLQNMFPTKG